MRSPWCVNITLLTQTVGNVGVVVVAPLFSIPLTSRSRNNNFLAFFGFVFWYVCSPPSFSLAPGNS